MGWTLEDSANNFPWRVGRKLGRTIYAQEGDDPADSDSLLGFMETPEIAATACLAVNRSRAEGPALPSRPRSADDFEQAVAWAAGFFNIAQHTEIGLDEGQQAILAGLVKRLDQLDRELLDA